MSKVYFIKVSNKDNLETIKTKFSKLLDESGILDGVSSGNKAVIKMHFGEEGNTGYVKPEYIKVLTEKLTQAGAEATLSDTNTLYKGKRMKCDDHLKLAHKHGFTPNKTGAKISIPDDKIENNVARIDISQEFIKTAKVVRNFIDADVLMNVAHFKGHMMTGFGGVLKNVGMGCATREGKLEQHTNMTAEVFTDQCDGCGDCVEKCPVDAITLVEGKARVDTDKCIGCADCIAVCPTGAMSVHWEEGGDTIQEKMVEYAKAVLDNVKSIHINFAIKITKECDCLAKDDPKIVPDIGIFASTDPVSIEKACLDLTTKAAGKDIFREVHPGRDGMKQLLHASEIGLGDLGYELVEMRDF
ncbi:MAG: DUF362 domain-containing protein [Candidatus Omnitrophota bacterium]